MSHKNSASVVLALSFVLLAGPLTAFAATTPSLGTATTFGVLSSTYTNTAAGTSINGDLGYTTPPAVAPAVTGATHMADAAYAQAGIDQGTALTNLNGQACTFTFAPGAIDLAADTTHGAIGVYTPGVYCTIGAASIGTAGITLSGNGTYIFRVSGALTTVANSAVTLTGGASACDVFWTPAAATTLGANSTFVGTNIDPSGITIGSTVTRVGRSLAFGGTVTTNADTMTVPTCTAPVVTPAPTPTPVPVVPTPTPTVGTPVVTPTPVPTPVVAPTPTLPNTGFAPREGGSAPWNVIIPAGILVALFSFYLARKKRVI